MLLLIVVWTVVTLCSSVYQVSIYISCKVFRRFLDALSQSKYFHVAPILKPFHWVPVEYLCPIKTATLVYRFLHSGFLSYLKPFLSLSSCSYRTRHINPDCQYLNFLLFNVLATCQKLLLLMLLRFGMTFQRMCPMQHLVPPSGKSSKLSYLQNPVPQTHLTTRVFSSMTWLCSMDLRPFDTFLVAS